MLKKDIKWSDEKRSSLVLQRNFLLLVTLVLSICTLIILILVKQMNDERNVQPYLIEYNKLSGMLSAVESKTKKEYTAQEAIIESLAIDYIKNREGLNVAILEDNINKVRVFSTQEVYRSFLDELGPKISSIKEMGKNAKINVTITSLTHISKSKIEIKFKSQASNEISAQDPRYMKAVVSFEFQDGELSFDDRIINPLNYQVVFYRTVEEKKLTESGAVS